MKKIGFGFSSLRRWFWLAALIAGLGLVASCDDDDNDDGDGDGGDDAGAADEE